MTSSGVRDHLLAILAADVAGYSRLMSMDDRGTVAALDAARAVFRQHIDAQGGRVVDMAGDSVLAVFETVIGSFAASLAIQQQLEESAEGTPPDRQMRFRIGLHIGDVIEKADGSVYGDGVNIAARLEALADPGALAVSHAVHMMLARRVDVDFEDLGEQSVKNIAQPVRAFRVRLQPAGASDTATAFPSSDTSRVASDNGHPARSRSHSIAVLPFANMSAEADQEYFSDGLAEEIIMQLATIPGLKVIARTSAFAFRGKEQDIRGIAEVLGVTHILEGSVRRSGNRLRITGQLIHAADGAQLWSQRYDRELNDIFAVQDEISAAIATGLRVQFASSTSLQRYAPNMAAYDVYLKARYLQAKVTPEALELARRNYERTIELDPTFAMAYVGLAYYWFAAAGFGGHTTRVAIAAMRAALDRAIQIDPNLPDAYALLGTCAMCEMDWDAAALCFEFPKAKQAGYTLSRPLYGNFLFQRGRFDEAIELARHAVEEDPLEVWSRMNLHAYLQGAGRNAEALEQLKRVLELDENQVIAMVSMSMLLADGGDLAAATEVARRANAVAPWLPDTVGLLAGLLSRSGQDAEAHMVASRIGSGTHVGDFRTHALHELLRGELEAGADWVEKAVEVADFSMMYYLRFVVCRELRASHRWPKIAAMMNLPAESRFWPPAGGHGAIR